MCHDDKMIKYLSLYMISGIVFGFLMASAAKFILGLSHSLFFGESGIMFQLILIPSLLLFSRVLTFVDASSSISKSGSLLILMRVITGTMSACVGMILGYYFFGIWC